MESCPIRIPLKRSALFTFFLIICWELFVLSGYGLGEVLNAPSYFLAHASLDLFFLFPAIAVALYIGIRLITKGKDENLNWRALLLSSAGSALVFLFLITPVNSLRIAGHDWLGGYQEEETLTIGSSYCTFSRDSATSLTNEPDVAASSINQVSDLLIQGLSVALKDQVVVLPIFLSLFAGWFLWGRRDGPGIAKTRLKKTGPAVVVGLSVAAFSVAAFQGGVFQIQTETPVVHGPTREFNVSAIPITMTLNRFGDHDEEAFMYVLDERIEQVRGEETLVNPDKVSTGLRKDVIQPLVIRANLGETVIINFTNRLVDGPASLHIHGLPHTIENASGVVGTNPNTTASPGETMTYSITLPDDPEAERAYYFRDHGAARRRVVHGLFGALVAEPAGSTHLDVETGEELTENNWEAIIVPPSGPAFREFVLMYHEIGDENYDGILDGNGRTLPVVDEVSETYRPSSRAINYRSESFHNRLSIKKDKSQGYGHGIFI
jgi:hypothetical protein